MSYKLAIIIPSWNSQNDIGRMLESIQSNTFIDYKVFVVDDLSTDHTVDVVKQYCQQDSRITLAIRNREPKGAQTCRNIGFQLSEGAEYVIWFDSDDVIAPYCLEQRVSYMDSHPELDFGVFLAKQYNNDLWDCDRKQVLGFRHPIGDLRRFFRRTIPFGVWTNIYRRRSLIVKDIQWDENILSLQDSDFNIQSILKDMTYDYAEKDGCKVDYFWHDNPNEGTVTKKITTEVHINSHLYFIQKQISSLSKEQRIFLSKDIDAMLFFFIDKFRDNEYFVRNFLSIPYIKNRVWFRFRVWLYCHIKVARSKLFPQTVSYMDFFNSVYWEKGQEILSQVCEGIYPIKYPDFEE